MRKTWIGVLVSAIVVVALAALLFTPAASQEKQTQVKQSQETQRMYVGVAKCKTCHKTEAQGAQFVVWEKSLHAKAFQNLAGEKAKAIAKEKGIDRARLVKTVEEAILKAAQSVFGPNRELQAQFNEETGQVDLFQFMTVVENVADPPEWIFARRH